MESKLNDAERRRIADEKEKKQLRLQIEEMKKEIESLQEDFEDFRNQAEDGVS